MAAKTGWHRYGTTLRHYHPIYVYRLMTCYCSHIVVIAAVLHCAAPVHIFTPPPIRERSIVMPVSVCLPASTYPKNYMSHLRQLFMHVTYVRGSILLWRRCDILCTSGFTDDVLLVHNGYAGYRNMRRNCDSIGCSMDLSPWRMLKLTHRAANRRQSLGPNLLNILRFIVRLS